VEILEDVRTVPAVLNDGAAEIESARIAQAKTVVVK
jgi:hypothetical protein